MRTTITFAAAAEAYIDVHKASWRNDKHADQWRNTLTTYANPVIGALLVSDITLGHIMRVLEPIWLTKTETASRVRGRLESVLDWATVRGFRSGENPARWRGHLDNLLPARSKVQKVEHHPALPYSEISSFMSRLRSLDGISPLAMSFLILTASRTSEAVGARWAEIDITDALWIIPGARMKAGRDHRVPLSSSALSILAFLASRRIGEYVFPGGKAGKPLSNMSLLTLLKRMDRADLTTHGFRSSFRDWASEQTDHPREVAEMALAHTIVDKVEAAYRRGDLMMRRRYLMEDWGRYCAPSMLSQPNFDAEVMQ